MCPSFRDILLTSCLFLSVTKSLTTAKSRNDNSGNVGANLVHSSGGWTEVTESQAATTISVITGRDGQETKFRKGDNGIEPHIKCPVVCSCGRDDGGRLEVLCLQGNCNKLFL